MRKIGEIEIIKANEMQLGDVVRLHSDFQNVYSHCTVKQITSENVILFRPYVHHSDFEYTGGVICYVGIEEYKIPVQSSTEYILLQAGGIKSTPKRDIEYENAWHALTGD